MDFSDSLLFCDSEETLWLNAAALFLSARDGWFGGRKSHSSKVPVSA